MKMKSKNIEDLNISQICYAHKSKDQSGRDIFLNIYPHQIAMEMFQGQIETTLVEVRKVKEGEVSRYWAWYKNYSKKPYMFIWPSKEQTLKCIPNYENKIKNQEGQVVNVVVKKWNKI